MQKAAETAVDIFSGAVSFAMNVAEILRILKLLSKYNL